MRNFQAKSRFRKLMESTPMLFVFAVVLCVFAWNVFGLLNKMNNAVQSRKLAEGKVSDLAESKVRLEADIARLATSEGIEETIREKYGMGREGERLVVVVEDKSSEDEDKEKEKTLMSFFQNLFK